MHYTLKITRQCVLRCYLSTSTRNVGNNDVFIVSAVRTPIGLMSLTSTQLGALAIEAAVKQAAIPRDAVEELYMGMECTAGVGQAPARQAALGAGLTKSVCTTTVNATAAVAGPKAIMLAAQALALGHVEVSVAGGMESASNVPYYMQRGATITYGHRTLADGLLGGENPMDEQMANWMQGTAQKLSISNEAMEEYLKAAYVSAVRASATGVFDAEVVPVRIQGKRDVVVAQDVLIEASGEQNSVKAVNTAAALVLCSTDSIQRFNLKPLARILDFQNAEAGTDAPYLAVSRLLERQGISPQDIDLWELSVAHPIIPMAFVRQMHVNPAKVNKHGNWAGGDASSSGLLVHLAHTLCAGQLGCAVSCNISSGVAAAILIEKCANPMPPKPVLTLYTKDPCPLCDILVDELQTHFAGEYELEKIFITQKENVRFLRLFRYDIPVLFLNGQFLCMHKLNMKLLRLRLMQLKY